MHLRGDSSLIYFVSEQPVVTKNDRKDSRVDPDTKELYFFFNEQGTKKLYDFTSGHLGRALGFVYVGSLRKIYTIEEIVDHGVIKFNSGKINMVNPPPEVVK